MNVDARQVILTFRKISAGMRPAVERAMTSYKVKGQSDARNIVQGTVYSRAENPKYPRSKNLLKSVDVEVVHDDEKMIYRLFNNPEKATNAFRWGRDGSDWPSGLTSYSSKPWDEYPAYVSEGNFFGNRVGANLDFYMEWFDEITPKVVENIAKAVKGL